MNIYKQLNLLTEYIEKHIDDDLHPEILTKFLHTNLYTAGKIFSVFSGQSFSEYVRKRRLSLAGQDLYANNPRVVDIAIKYGYDNATAFSRAFEKFHGIKPSQVNKTTKLSNYPRLIFDDTPRQEKTLNYEIITLPDFTLFGVGVDTGNDSISKDAPQLFRRMINEYEPIYGPVKYGAVLYDSGRQQSKRYYCLWEQEISGFTRINIPKSRWLKFDVGSREAAKIQALSLQFYSEFLPSSKYILRELPELEHYHDKTTDFLVPIE